MKTIKNLAGFLGTLLASLPVLPRPRRYGQRSDNTTRGAFGKTKSPKLTGHDRVAVRQRRKMGV